MDQGGSLTSSSSWNNSFSSSSARTTQSSIQTGTLNPASSFSTAHIPSIDLKPPPLVDKSKFDPDILPNRPPREQQAREEERRGDIHFKVVWNDNDPGRLEALIGAKTVISKQLPNMPRSYILRFVLDKSHRTLCLMKGQRVIGSICFRPFHSQKFAEIVFCAIDADFQVRGYGTRIMNYLKEHVKMEGIEYFLTYADNHAIGYFTKQGFSKLITMPMTRWDGYIKHYNDSTLMECAIIKGVDYTDISGLLLRQKQCVVTRMKKASNSDKVYPGLKFELAEGGDGKQLKQIPLATIAGLQEAGWTEELERAKQTQLQSYSSAHGFGSQTSSSSLGGSSSSVPPSSSGVQLRANLGQVLKQIKVLREAWPFKEPVNAELVPDYYQVIKEPMDLRTMTTRLDQGYYTSSDQFCYDFNLIVKNCCQYNSEGTVYVQCAKAIQKKFQKFMARVMGLPI